MAFLKSATATVTLDWCHETNKRKEKGEFSFLSSLFARAGTQGGSENGLEQGPYCCGAGFAKTVSATGALIFTSVNFSVVTAFQVECLTVNGSFTPLTSR